MAISKQNLINPPKCYRPLPFWSWNSKLIEEETLFQVAEMDKVGMGGFFMHARGGLKTEYMGKEWMDNVRAATLDASKRGMEPWGYDENGWPSGFGSGMVNGLGVKYQQKYIYMEYTDAPVEDEFTIANLKSSYGKNMHFYFGCNRFYIDGMDSEVTDAFIACTHEKYKEALGDDFAKMTGFFTDEPQLSRADKSIPWSLILPREFQKKYGEDLLPLLPHLFITSDEAYATRYKYWKLVTELFSRNFMKRIYDWCEENGSKLTGHMVLEESYSAQLDSNGACMPSYMYMHIPGVDKLCRSVDRDLLAPQVTSVCAQKGTKQVLTESFALCGWDVSFEELKWILEWQMVKGANLLCQHLAGYSLAGIRKRDFPAGHFYQNTWWNDYKMFNDFASRVGMLLAEGEINCEVLVLHTISSAWLERCDDHDWQTDVDQKYCKPLLDIMTCLDKNQIIHHLGDDTVMEALGAKIENGKFVVGKMAYSVVIVPSALNICSNTARLLEEFAACGGKIIFTGDIPRFTDGVKSDALSKINCIKSDGISDLLSLIPECAKYISLSHADGSECDVQYARRVFDEYKMHYFVNTYSSKENAIFKAKAKSLARFDYMTGEVVPYPFKRDGEYVTAEVCIEEKGSVIFFTYDDDSFSPYDVCEKKTTSINDKLFGNWNITLSDPNAITLDMCDLYIDGELIGKKFPVSEIEELANSYEKQINIKMDFEVKSNIDLEGEAFIVIEESKYYDIFINGNKIEKKKCGYFRDKSFEKLAIDGYIKKGTNIITLVTDFVQPDSVYEDIRNCYEFEAMVNKLCYDREVETIYLLGSFCVESESEYKPAPNRSYVTDGDFVLAALSSTVADGDLVRQGFPFYTGKLTLTKKITLSANEIENRCISFDRMGAVITEVSINGKKLPKLIWAPYSFDLTGYLKEGENVIEIELTNNFRNLLGPLHLGCESYEVTPGSFYRKSKVYGWTTGKWHENYAFLENGIFLEK
ncbi:MAG: hypothetical protein J6B23_09745 [Clostridia bacterium]|nr:hypothetical protein [Clostridia bacterium]